MTYFRFCTILFIGSFVATAQGFTLSLEQAMDMAAKNNLPLQEARARWLTNKNDKNIALSYLMPQISLAQSKSKNRTVYPQASDQGFDVSRTYTEQKSTASLTQELFNMSTYYLYSKANQQALQDLLIYQNALQSLSLSVCDQYFQLILAIENLIFLESEKTEIRKRQQDVEAQVQYGSMTKSQLLEVKAQVKRVEANIIEAKQIIANQKDLLADSIGSNQFNKINMLSDNPQILKLTIPALKYWINDTKEHNLSLKIAKNNLAQAKLLHKASVSDYLPTLSLKANYDHYKYPDQTLKVDNNDTTNISSNT